MNVLHHLKSAWFKRQLTRPELNYMLKVPTSEQWVAIDCEMTGLNPKQNHLLSIAAIHINSNKIDIGSGLHIICRPPVMPKEDTILIHGLRPIDVENGMNYDDMLDLLLPFIGNRPIVGFCPQIDIGFLNPLVRKYMGIPLPNQIIDIRSLYNQHTGNRTQGITHQDQHLNNICKQLKLPDLNAHDAYNDAMLTAMAFLHSK